MNTEKAKKNLSLRLSKLRLNQGKQMNLTSNFLSSGNHMLSFWMR